jgi:uncharacterized protein YbcV (DUF1398 family)
MDTKTMHAAREGSATGQLTFPEVVKMLIGAGVESYQVDFENKTDTFYLPDGQTHSESLTAEIPASAADFTQDEVIAAIRAAQSDTIRYPEFVKRIRKAGVVAYRVFITGKRAIYFGHKGEIHIEEFPR